MKSETNVATKLGDRVARMYDSWPFPFEVVLALALPTICAPFFIDGVLRGGDRLGEWWMSAIGVVVILFAAGHAVTKCSVGTMVVNLVAALCLLWSVRYAGLAGLPYGLAMCVSIYVGMVVTAKVSRRMEERASASRGVEASVVTEEDRNNQKVKCGSCHCRSYCVYQPDGMADRYEVGAPARMTK